MWYQIFLGKLDMVDYAALGLMARGYTCFWGLPLQEKQPRQLW